MPYVTVEAPGKVNLVLRVLGRRDDGFHEIESLMIGVGLCDRLVFEEAPGHDPELECRSPTVPAGEANLVCRAARALAARLDRPAGCRIRLEKRIPIGGGMGGGSSDAAAALIGLNRLWRAGLSSDALAELGAELGSDVPFFFDLPSAIVSGRGEQVRPVRLGWKGWLALVMAGVEVSTRQVYERCVPAGAGEGRPSLERLTKIERADGLRGRLVNELEEAVFAVAPQVERLRDILVGMGIPQVRVSGAGSVLFALYDDQKEACEMVEAIRSSRVADNAMVVEAPVS